MLVSGCHFGDCHYMFGNERAAEQFDRTKAVVRLLGIEDSAAPAGVDQRGRGHAVRGSDQRIHRPGSRAGAESAQFDGEYKEVTLQQLAELAKQTKAWACYDCGKCTATCPISRAGGRAQSPKASIGHQSSRAAGHFRQRHSVPLSDLLTVRSPLPGRGGLHRPGAEAAGSGPRRGCGPGLSRTAGLCNPLCE